MVGGFESLAVQEAWAVDLMVAVLASPMALGMFDTLGMMDVLDTMVSNSIETWELLEGLGTLWFAEELGTPQASIALNCQNLVVLVVMGRNRFQELQHNVS